MMRSKIMLNLVTTWQNWRKVPIRTHFDWKYNTQFGCEDFYKTVKPYLSDKGNGCHGSDIILREGDVIITDPDHVADVFNTCYAFITEYESESDGVDNLFYYRDMMEKHPSHESIVEFATKFRLPVTFTCALFLPILQKYLPSILTNCDTIKLSVRMVLKPFL